MICPQCNGINVIKHPNGKSSYWRCADCVKPNGIDITNKKVITKKTKKVSSLSDLQKSFN